MNPPSKAKAKERAERAQDALQELPPVSEREEQSLVWISEMQSYVQLVVTSINQ